MLISTYQLLILSHKDKSHKWKNFKTVMAFILFFKNSYSILIEKFFILNVTNYDLKLKLYLEI